MICVAVFLVYYRFSQGLWFCSADTCILFPPVSNCNTVLELCDHSQGDPGDRSGGARVRHGLLNRMFSEGYHSYTKIIVSTQNINVNIVMIAASPKAMAALQLGARGTRASIPRTRVRSPCEARIGICTLWGRNGNTRCKKRVMEYVTGCALYAFRNLKLCVCNKLMLAVITTWSDFRFGHLLTISIFPLCFPMKMRG